MKSVSVAEAKAHLSELIEEAAAGEPVCITRRGKPIAQITAIKLRKKRIDAAMLRRLTERMTPQTEGAGEFIRQMRDSDRY